MTDTQLNEIKRLNEMMKKLRNGETVTCDACGKGFLNPIGNYKSTHCFVCDSCGAKLNLD